MAHKVLFLDTETTSVNTEKCGLIQISGIVEIDGNPVEEFDIRSSIFPEDEVSEEALVKNGVSLEQIQSFQPPKAAFFKLLSILKKHVDKYDKLDKFIVVAYVSSFDNAVLRSWFKKNHDDYFGSWFWNPWIDTMNLAIYVYQNRRFEFENFKQITVAKFVGINVDDRKAHDALYDVRMCRQIYKNITQ